MMRKGRHPLPQSVTTYRSEIHESIQTYLLIVSADVF